MSTEYRTYVGPYLRCAVAQKEVTQLRISCITPECANYGRELRTPFCDRCGKRVGSLPRVTVQDAVDHWDVSEAIDESLSIASGDGYMTWSNVQHVHVWLPNQHEIGRYLETRTDWYLEDLDPITISQEQVAFQSYFDTEITYLRTLYTSVDLHWGILQDYS